MSDIKAQSRRDAEFDRLADEIIRDLGGMSESEIHASLLKVLEMGKRHGRDEGRSELLREIERERHIAMEEA